MSFSHPVHSTWPVSLLATLSLVCLSLLQVHPHALEILRLKNPKPAHLHYKTKQCLTYTKPQEPVQCELQKLWGPTLSRPCSDREVTPPYFQQGTLYTYTLPQHAPANAPETMDVCCTGDANVWRNQQSNFRCYAPLNMYVINGGDSDFERSQLPYHFFRRMCKTIHFKDLTDEKMPQADVVVFDHHGYHADQQTAPMLKVNLNGKTVSGRRPVMLPEANKYDLTKMPGDDDPLDDVKHYPKQFFTQIPVSKDAPDGTFLINWDALFDFLMTKGTKLVLLSVCNGAAEYGSFFRKITRRGFRRGQILHSLLDTMTLQDNINKWQFEDGVLYYIFMQYGCSTNHTDLEKCLLDMRNFVHCVTKRGFDIGVKHQNDKSFQSDEDDQLPLKNSFIPDFNAGPNAVAAPA